LICVTWLIDMCDMTHSYVWHDSLICVTWLIDMCERQAPRCRLYSSTLCVCVCKRDMSHSYEVTHMSDFICVTWLINMHSCLTWLMHMYSRMQHDLFIYVRNEPLHIICFHVRCACIRVTWLIHICDTTQSYLWRDTFIMWHDAFICFHVRDMTHSNVWHYISPIGGKKTESTRPSSSLCSLGFRV